MQENSQEKSGSIKVKISSKLLFGLLFLSLIGIIIGIQYASKGSNAGDMILSDLSNATEKIPYNTKVLTVTLNSPINSDSITPKTVTLSPFVAGSPSLSPDKKTISYILQKSLEIGESYELTVASEVKKEDGTNLGKDKVIRFQAIPGPQALKIFPTGSLDTLGQNITVVFNTPMVPLTNLDERDKLLCPLTITPKIEGRCVWTNTSILEFIPTSPLQGATRYKMQVRDIPGLLHTLSGSLDGEIVTTPLRVSVSGEFSPLDGVSLWTNFPVSQENLTKSVEFYSGIVQPNSIKENKIEMTITPIVNEKGVQSETRFTLAPKTQKFMYQSNYTAIIRTTLAPKYGTEPLQKEEVVWIRTNNFVRSVETFQNILDNSGVIVDTKGYESGINGKILPSERVFFLVTVDHDIVLDPSLLILRSQVDQSALPFDLSYGKYIEYDQQGNVIKTTDNKSQIKIVPKASLKKDTPYEIVFLKKANSSMLADEVLSFRTAQEFVVSGFTPLSNTEGCIYTNNKVQEYYNYNEYGESENNASKSLPRIVTTPSSRTPTLSLDYGQYIWNENGQSYSTKYTCSQISGKNAYVVNMRLSPNLAYTIEFLGGLTDEYNQGLSKKTSFSLKSGPTAEKDKFLYSSLAGGQTQVIPSNLPIVLGLLSVNTDEANIDICETDIEGYIEFLTLQRNVPYPYPTNCTQKTTKKVSIKNRFWTTTPTKFDIEKDIIGQSFSSPFVYVKGSLPNYDPNLQQSFDTLFIRSNLSLTLEDAKNNRLIFASSYDGKTLPSDLTFDAYRWVYDDYNNGKYEKINKFPIVLDAKKQVYKITNSDIEFDLLIAKNDNYFGVLNLNQDQTSNYDFKYISGMDAMTRDYLYIYPDRPLYQLSDTVYFKGILRTFHFDGYHPSLAKKGKVKIVGGQGTVSGESVIAEMDVTIDENSNFHGEFTLPKSAPLGRYAFEFYGSGSDGPMTQIYNNGEFFIEAYKKPVFKVTANIPKPDAMIGDTVDIKSHAEYYFGGALAGAEYQYSVLSQSYYFNPGAYQNFHFGEGSVYMDCLYWGSCEFNDSMESSGTGVLDAKGDGNLQYEYKKGDAKGEQIYTYSIEATDPDTQKTVNKSVSQVLHATDAYVGVMAPYWNSGKSGVKLEGVVLDYGAKGLAGKTVGLQLVKRDWKNVKKEGVDGVFYNEGSIEETLIATDTVKTDTEGMLSYTFLSATGGEYEIRATYTGSNGVPFTSSVYTYVSVGEDEYYWYEGNNTVADLTADATILSIGDTAGFTLKTPIKSGKMLVTIEKDDGILDYYLQDITNTTSRIEFPILDSYIPNVYVKVFALGQNAGENLPIYKRALSVVKVLSDPKKLTVTVNAEKKQYLPGEAVKLTVNVKDAKGNGIAGANGSLSIVDESLLALAGNPQKNPFAYLYDMKRYLGVVTYTSLLNLIQKLEVKDTSLGEKGGAGEGQKGGLSKKKRGVFKDTAFWQADFKTDQNGKYTLTTPVLPDNLTTWVIEALINTKKSEVGVGATHIQTTKMVVINDNLPRFLGTSDTVMFAPVVFNKTDKDASFDVSIEANNITIKNPKQTVTIKSGGQISVPFEIVVDGIEKVRHLVPQATKITIKAVSQATNDQDTIEMTLPIIETTTREMVVTSGRADPKRDEQIDLEAKIKENGGSLDIHYAATLLPGLLSGLDFLANYPYGCLEQQLATVMPQVYIKELYDSIGVPYDLSTKMTKRYVSKEEGYRDISLKEVINNVMGNIGSFQQYDGGFGYWTDSTSSDLSLTLSTVSRLQDLSHIGFVVAPEILNGASRYIKNTFYTNRRPYCLEVDCSYSLTERFHMIEGMLDSHSDDYEAYKMYQLIAPDMKKENAEWINTSLSHARLLLMLAGLKDVNDAMKKELRDQSADIIRKVANENIVNNPRGSFIGRSNSASRLLNTLEFVETVTLFGGNILAEHRDILDQMSRWVMSQKYKDGSWGSTYDTMRVIRSITAIERSTGELRSVNLESSLTLDGTLLEKKTINKSNNLEVFTKSLTLDALKESSILHFEKTGTGRIYYDIALEYALRASTLASRDEGFFIESAYYDYASYRAVENAKKEEWKKYIIGEIDYSDLKYPNDSITYIKSLQTLKVGQLVIVHNRMILAEPRDQVAFEGFIPAGPELVNPNLKTESQDVGGKTLNTLFDHEEWQDDRYFATASSLDAGIYGFEYIFRPTHVGTYELRPTRVGEFYHGEIFGRTQGKSITIMK